MGLKRVLIQSDDGTTVDLLPDTLASLGCSVEVFQNVGQLKNMFKVGTYHACFMRVDPHELKDMLTIESISKEFPQVLLVGMGEFTDGLSIEHAAMSGCYLILRTPINYDDAKHLTEKFIKAGPQKEEIIFELMHNIIGINFTPANKKMIHFRLEKRGKKVHRNSLQEYVDYFFENISTELNQLISTLTTHTTSFFREPGHFNFLLDKVFPTLLLQQRPLKIWSASCSTGQEIYSIAMTFREYCKDAKVDPAIRDATKFIASDVDQKSLEIAKNGVYVADEVEMVSKDMLSEYFDKGTGDLAGLFRIRNNIYASCKFEQVNLLSNQYPTENFDIIFLRHTLIYFKEKQLREILEKIVEKLLPGGFLFLSLSESGFERMISLKSIRPAIFQKESDQQGTARISMTDDVLRKIRVIITDDSQFVRKKLKDILGPESGFEVVGEAENPLELMKLL